MAYVTVIHRDPPLDPKKAKNFSYIQTFVKKNDVHVVSFISAYDGFYERADEKTIAKINIYRKMVSGFIKENDLIDKRKNPLFGVDANPAFETYAVGFKHTALRKLLQLIKKQLVEDVRFYKDLRVVMLVNVHEQHVFDLID